MAYSKVRLNGTTIMDITSDTVAADKLYSPYTAHGADGEPIIGTASSGGIDVSDTTATANRVREGYYFYTADGVKTEGTIPNLSAHTYYPSTTDQTISTSQFISGTQTIKAVTTSNITAANIKKGTVVTVGDSANASRILSVTGTYAGPGVLLATKSLGTITTSGSSATDTGQTVTVSGINNYDLLVLDISVNSITNNRHTSTVTLIFLTASSSASTKDAATIASAKYNSKISSSAVTTTRANTTAYGLYANSCTVSDGSATLAIYYRYNSTQTGTISGNAYTARVYGVNLIDLIGG